MTPPGSHAEPSGIFVDGSQLYISFGGADSRVDVFNPSTYVYSIGKGELNNPSDILRVGRLLNVVDSGNNVIRQYSMSWDGKTVTPAGQWIPPQPPLPTATGMTHLNLDSKGQELLVSGGNGVLIMDQTMAQIMPPLGQGYLNQAGGADSLASEECALSYFVADSSSKRIYRYTYREDELQVRQVWDNFLSAIRNSNIELARSYIHPLALGWFDFYINRWGQRAPLIANDFLPGSTLMLIKLCPNGAAFNVMGNMDVDGTGPRLVGAELRLLKDGAGEWKIFEF